MDLTKSDFIVARTCGTKLYYKKLRDPSINDDNPYLEFLADGGYMVETMAKLLPEGMEVGYWDKPDLATEETRLRLQTPGVTLFEATVVQNGLFARFDILRRVENDLHLIEVKSSSIDSATDGANPFRGKRGGIASEWLPYLEDVTFQTLVLRRAFPQFKIVPFLCVVDKAKSATENTTFDKFRLVRTTDGAGQWRPQVAFLGDSARLQHEHVLAIIPVSSEVDELITDVQKAADELAETLHEPIRRVPPSIGKKCKGCEYRIHDSMAEKNGFRECWGALADADPHTLDLYRIDSAGGKNRDLVAELAAKGHSALSDVPPGSLSGAFAPRQILQLECTAQGREEIAPALRAILAAHPYPLHFIDFEGSRLAIPYHPGMRPYEQTSFQWSCHTISAPESPVAHAKWLNGDDAFPNFEFARSLRDQIGDEGTVYIWSSYEVVILREIRDQMRKYGCDDPGLAEWIDALTMPGNPRVVDLCALAKDYYFHPAMKGSLSIKHVLPAVWEADARIRADPLFVKYEKRYNDGELLNPYATLPPLPIGESEEVVKEGTGAMRVYQEMMFGRAKDDPEIRETYRRLLLQYCELDTAAMVAIWMHWLNSAAPQTYTQTA